MSLFKLDLFSYSRCRINSSVLINKHILIFYLTFLPLQGSSGAAQEGCSPSCFKFSSSDGVRRPGLPGLVCMLKVLLAGPWAKIWTVPLYCEQGELSLVTWIDNRKLIQQTSIALWNLLFVSQKACIRESLVLMYFYCVPLPSFPCHPLPTA